MRYTLRDNHTGHVTRFQANEPHKAAWRAQAHATSRGHYVGLWKGHDLLGTFTPGAPYADAGTPCPFCAQDELCALHLPR